MWDGVALACGVGGTPVIKVHTFACAWQALQTHQRRQPQFAGCPPTVTWASYRARTRHTLPQYGRQS